MTQHPLTRCGPLFLCIWLVNRHELAGQDQSPRSGGDLNVAESTPAEVIFTETIDTGFTFVGSEYLSPPYLVQATADSVTVNGRVLTHTTDLLGRELDVATLVSETSADGDRPRRGSGRERGQAGPFEGRRRRVGGGTRFAATWIADNLRQEAAIVDFSDRQPFAFFLPSDRQDLLSALLNPDPASREVQVFLEGRGSETEQELWKNWVTGVNVSEELRTRAAADVELVLSVEEETLSAMRANQRLHALAYPLTVLGMVLGVLALGHLLKSFARLEGAQESTLPPEVLRATTISIGLMVALSLFDLAWTILASQAGQMRELNPLGSRLISDPVSLILFKFAATLVGCGILFALRRHSRARQACWWLCLVCTVLTFRWVMFNSMFVA